MKLKEWAALVYLMPDKRLRDPGSKHQKKIKEIQDLIKDARLYLSQDTLIKLLSIELIECQGNTEYEAHCRYLQYCLNRLRESVQTSKSKEDRLCP